MAIGILPYTFGVQMPTNVKLLGKLQEIKGLEKEDRVVEAKLREEGPHYLVDRWGVLNLGRCVLLVGSAVLGTWTAVSN